MIGVIENMLYNRENLDLMYKMDSNNVDLIYVDPPFFTQKKFKDFNDRFENIENYMEWIKIRVKEMYRILKETGSIYLHCDYHASHQLKMIMDEIFIDGFKSEIIWVRKNQSKGTSLGHNHDSILYYVKNPKDFTFNTCYIDKKVDKPIFWDSKPIKTAPAGGYSEDTQKKMLDAGNAYYTKNGKVRQITFLSKDLDGNVIDRVPISNIWSDIPNMMHTPKNERTKYSTQKPEKLLERIINMSSNSNDLVFDPFCGSGTTAVVCKKLQRKYISCDINLDGLIIAQQRLERIK